MDGCFEKEKLTFYSIFKISYSALSLPNSDNVCTVVLMFTTGGRITVKVKKWHDAFKNTVCIKCRIAGLISLHMFCMI